MTGSQVRILFAAPAFLKSQIGWEASPEHTCALQTGLRDLSHIPPSPPRLVSCQHQPTPANNRRLNMRKFILIAALVLASASAQAGVTRSLTMASNDEPAPAEQPKASDVKGSEVKAVEAPKYVDRPAAVSTTTEAPKADQAKPIAGNNTQTPKVEKPKCKRESTEARVIHELHRHGIYW